MAFSDDIRFIVSFLLFSIAIGVVGFRLFCGTNWYDSLCHATMTIGGNYFITKGERGVLFISLYSLYGSLIFFAIAALVVNQIYWQMKGEEKLRSPPRY